MYSKDKIYIEPPQQSNEVAFKLCFTHYTVQQMKNSMRSVFEINQDATEKIGEKHDCNSKAMHREAILCLSILTPCVFREMEHKGGQR